MNLYVLETVDPDNDGIDQAVVIAPDEEEAIAVAEDMNGVAMQIVATMEDVPQRIVDHMGDSRAYFG